MEQGRLRAPNAEERAAATVAVATHLAPTPLIAADVPTPSGLRRVWCKLETLQPTGSFKIRGALAALSSLSSGASAVSASAGNHALGLCQAALWLRRSVTVVTPEDASPAKVDAIRALVGKGEPGGAGPTLVQHGRGYEEAEAHALALAAAAPDAVYVSAYSDAHVIAGQGTLVAEVADQLPAGAAPPLVVVPLGGGGLARGVGLAVAERAGWGLCAVEVEASRAVSAAVGAGQLVTVPIGASAADGLLGNLEADSPTPGILGHLVAAGTARLTTVSEAELRAAVGFAAGHLGLVVEGAGAAGLAALRAGALDPEERPVVVVLSGRNIAASLLASILTP